MDFEHFNNGQRGQQNTAELFQLRCTGSCDAIIGIKFFISKNINVGALSAVVARLNHTSTLVMLSFVSLDA